MFNINTQQNPLEAAYQMQLNQMNVYKNTQSSILNEIQQFTQNLTSDEINTLSSLESFKIAKSQYESAFMDYLSSIHSANFVNTQQGKSVADNLLKTIKENTSIIKSKALEDKEKLNKLAKLLEEHPELIEKLK